MRVGVFLLAAQFPGQGAADALARAVDCAVAAEEAGFDDVWMAEHHFIPYGVCPSAVTFAAYALGRTRRITVGTAISVLSTAHPVALGEQTALLDQLSGGRFHLGVGRGGPWLDLEVFGTGPDRYAHGLAESLDLLLRWLADESVRADGSWFRFREVPVVPRPSTRPRPPVTLACTSESSVTLAAQRGLPMLLGMHVGDDEKARLVRRYAEVARAHGRDPEGVPHMGAALAYVADSREQALSILRAEMPPWLERGVGAYRRVDDEPRKPFDPHAYTELLCGLHAAGPPGHCVERLAASARRTGIRHAILMVEGGGTRERALENIARLGAEVLPALRGVA
jgi:alkanesulfonate monooxygenase SsuD/methylene tetrahydromethanopterin reductase-like flavin-dependent oxidoreductase (luciferase family)